MKISKIFDICFIFLMLVLIFGIRFANVSGSSMENTLEDGDYVIVNKFDRSYNRGDIIVFSSNTLNEYLIKRVIGVEGDIISFSPNGVLVNNELIHEDYIKSQNVVYFSDKDSYEIGKNQYFVMGDNRNNSLDSRREEVGVISSDCITGKVVFNITKATGLKAYTVEYYLKLIVLILVVFYFASLIININIKLLKNDDIE